MFDYTVDHIDAREPHQTQEPTATGKTQNKNFINNGYSSIKELEELIRHLDGENYRLKLNIVAMQRLLSGTPEEQRKLLAENISLQTEADKLRQEILRLQEINNDSLSNKENTQSSKQSQLTSENSQLRAQYSQLDSEYTQLKSEFRAALEEKDHDLHQFKHQLEVMKSQLEESESKRHIFSENADSNNHEVKQALRAQQNTNDKLQHRIQDLESENNQLKYSLDQSQSNIQRLEGSLKSLNSQLHDKEVSNIKENDKQLKELSNEAAYWKKKYESQDEFNQASGSELFAAKQEIKALKAQLEDAQYSSQQAASNLAQREAQLESVTSQLHDKEMEAGRTLDNHFYETKKLRKEIEILEDELRNKNLEKVAPTTNYAQESQNRSLQAKNKFLNEEVKDLKATIDLMKNDLSGVSKSNSTELNRLQNDIRNRDHENDLLTNKLNNLNLELQSLQLEVSRNEELILDLRSENRELRLSTTTESDVRLQSERLEMERLQSKLSTMTSLIDKVQNLLQVDHADQLTSEIQDLLYANDELKSLVKKYHSKSEELEQQFSKSRYDSDAKDLRISRLETTLNSLENEIRNKAGDLQADEYSRLLRLRSDDEIKIRHLEYELENLQKQHQSDLKRSQLELNQQQEKIRLLESQYEFQKELSNTTKNSGPSAIQTLLETQLQDATRLSSELTKLLADANTNKELVEQRLNDVEAENAKLLETTSLLEKTGSSATRENNALSKKNKELTQDLLRVTSHCKKLANKINELTNNQILQERLGKLHIDDSELVKTKANNAYLQRKVDAMGSIAPKKLALYENQLTYYKARLHDVNLRANDFQLMYMYAINAIKNSNLLIKDDINKLAQCGIYPDYMNQRKTNKLTMKTLAQFVLASVRIRRRYERSTRRNVKLMELKTEIETAKIVLLP